MAQVHVDVMPPLIAEAANGACAADDEDSDGDSADELEMQEEAESTTCLFCTQTYAGVDLAMQHLQEVHHISFAQLKARFQMDQYAFLKLINCIRSEQISAQRLAETQQVFWQDEKYLKPKEYEPWLSYDYDELPAETTGSNEEQTKLRARVQSLQQQVKQQTLLLEQASEDMSKLRVSFQRLIEQNGEEPLTNCVSTKSLQSDESYFSSYAHFGIHHEMLSDVVRTTSYRDALLRNKSFVRGKDVLDVGCGTSVLSIFAAQAGAKAVVGIDNSDIIYNAMDIVKRNNIPNVTLIKGRLENTQLPQQQYDIIISEWMGYFLLFEGMLDSIIYARDHHLKPGGMLLPNRCTMSLVGYGSDELYSQQVAFWHDVYGLDMSNMRQEVLHEPLIDVVDAQHVLTDANTVADLHLASVDLNYSNFTYDFQLKCNKRGNLSAFVGYFDTYFDLPTPVMFGTGPNDKPTHWKQVVFFVEQPQAVQIGELITGQLACRRSNNNARSLDITIAAFGKKFTYYLD